ETACEELRREAGHQFDRDVVEALIHKLSGDWRAAGWGGAEPAKPRIADEAAAYLRTVLARPLPEHLVGPLAARHARADAPAGGRRHGRPEPRVPQAHPRRPPRRAPLPRAGAAGLRVGPRHVGGGDRSCARSLWPALR